MQYIQIPAEEKIYKIDLNTRTVEAPNFLAVTDEHNAEILWFSVDRFFDSYDLRSTSCWIQYTNANKESIAYKFKETKTTSNLEKIISDKVTYNISKYINEDDDAYAIMKQAKALKDLIEEADLNGEE